MANNKVVNNCIGVKQMQELLIKKQNDEKEFLQEQTKDEKPRLLMKHVIYQRDNLQERLKMAHEEIEDLNKKLKHYNEIRI